MQCHMTMTTFFLDLFDHLYSEQLTSKICSPEDFDVQRVNVLNFFFENELHCPPSKSNLPSFLPKSSDHFSVALKFNSEGHCKFPSLENVFLRTLQYMYWAENRKLYCTEVSFES